MDVSQPGESPLGPAATPLRLYARPVEVHVPRCGPAAHRRLVGLRPTLPRGEWPRLLVAGTKPATARRAVAWHMNRVGRVGSGRDGRSTIRPIPAPPKRFPRSKAVRR